MQSDLNGQRPRFWRKNLHLIFLQDSKPGCKHGSWHSTEPSVLRTHPVRALKRSMSCSFSPASETQYLWGM